MLQRFRQGLFVILLSVSAAFSGALADEKPSELIQRLGGEAIMIAAKRDATNAQRIAGFETLFEKGFDVPLVARIVLGRYWRVATPAQQEEFVSLFHKYIVNAYAQRLNAYDGQKFEITGTQPLNETETVVKSVIREPSGNALKVEWRVLKRGDDPRIIDVMVEGVSMAITQRSEFSSIISKTGNVETLLERLRAQVGKG